MTIVGDLGDRTYANKNESYHGHSTPCRRSSSCVAHIPSITARTSSSSPYAELWFQLGFVRKSEDLGVQAYARGSLKAEAVLKNAYVARTGSDAGFQDYLIVNGLRESELRRNDSVNCADELLGMPPPGDHDGHIIRP